MTAPAFDPDRAAGIIAWSSLTLFFLTLAWLGRLVLDARKTRRRLRHHQVLAVESNHALTCQLCRESHHRLQLVHLAEDVTFVCDGCHAVLAGPEVVK